MTIAYLAESVGDRAQVTATWLDWALYVVLIPLGFVALCIFLFNRRNAVPTFKKSALVALVSIAMGLTTAALVWVQHGTAAGQEWLTGWAVELSLSFDNVFAWGLIISAFGLWKGYHARLVMWGVLIAIALRVVLLFSINLVTSLWIVSLILGLALFWTGIKLFRGGDEDFDLFNHPVYKFFSRRLPLAQSRYGTSWFTRQEGKLKVTVFLLAVVVLGFVDIAFAFDSIPAILAVAHDPFIIVSSNMMALLGLQALYFLYDGIKDAFDKLDQALAFIMLFIGAKIILGSELFDWCREHIGFWPRWLGSYEIPTTIALVVVLSMIALGVGLSEKFPTGRFLAKRFPKFYRSEPVEGPVTLEEELTPR
jgi:tellurite resistance protein TerC